MAAIITAGKRDDRQSPEVYQIEPLTDSRWGEFVNRHPRSSIFHTVPWLEALRRTYAYEPIVYTTTPPGIALRDGLVFCRVASWLTGRRLVSLPFSDHCEPLIDDAADPNVLLSAVERMLGQEKLRYIEIRPKRVLELETSLSASNCTYCLHELDLSHDLDSIFRHCHKDSTQRKIRRAEREGLTYEYGRSGVLLKAFYHLLVLTRRRHQLPPQPMQWFENLIDCCGEALQIRVAFKDRQPIAAILTLFHGDTVTYKYGCSDAKFNNLGGTHLLFWRTIQEAKSNGFNVFDLGRSEYENTGLITFKDRWGTARSELRYLRFATSAQSSEHYRTGGGGWKVRMAKRVMSGLPAPLLSTVGNLLYRHIG